MRAYPVEQDGQGDKAHVLFLMARARIMLRLDLTCPHCREARGHPCRTPEGRYLSVAHSQRGQCVRCS